VGGVVVMETLATPSLVVSLTTLPSIVPVNLGSIVSSLQAAKATSSAKKRMLSSLISFTIYIYLTELSALLKAIT
jgi:hypothetical protein